MTMECEKRQNALVAQFLSLRGDQERYKWMIDKGRKLEPIDPAEIDSNHLVQGCQSRTYLLARAMEGRLHFRAQSDALISAGLAALLIDVYSDEEPEVILTCPPTFASEIDLARYLTPSRSNGLFAVHLKMKQEAVRHLAKSGGA